MAARTSRILPRALAFVCGALAATPAPSQERYYPEAAQKAKVEGTAAIACTVTADQKLEDCVVKFESPTGWVSDAPERSSLPAPLCAMLGDRP
jgi:hypothetical protein